MSRALVLGTGLIGASIGAGLSGAGWEVAGWDPSPRALTGAEAMGGIDRVVDDPWSVVSEFDLVVLAGPVRSIIDTLGRLDTATLVTDVAGVKGSVVAGAAHLDHFVGGHPMAGRESSGPGAASASMFRGANWILVTDGARADDLSRMEEIVESLGAVAVRMTASEHDAAVAAVSHVPQMLASALVNLVGVDGPALSLAADGFRDVTRIALSDPTWWGEVLAENRVAVAGLLGTLGKDLDGLADALLTGDTERVGSSLEVARQVRQGLTAPVAAVRVLLEDRPGEIARVGHALATSGVDVRDLQLRHATRGGGGVLTLSVPPGQDDLLRSSLASEGFRLV